MFGILKQHEIEQLLSQQVVGRIGCHGHATTYVVPISYAYDGDFIYCHANDGMKIDIMRQNPDVCFQVDDMRNMANWKSVITWGKFEELKDHEGRNLALRILNERNMPAITSATTHLSPQWPFPADEAELKQGILFRIHLHKKTGRFETYSASHYTS